MARIFKPAKNRQSQNLEKAPERLIIESLSPEGRGVARHNGKTVFVSGALPGETVSVSHYRRHQRYSECQMKQVELASTDRTEPFCEYFAQCGGCELQHMALEPQLLFKQTSLVDSLTHHLGHSNFQVLAAVESPELYRSRARVGVSRSGKLGFRKKRSKELVFIQQCPILEQDLQSLWWLLQEWLDECESRPAITHLELLKGDDDLGIVLRSTRTMAPEALAGLNEKLVNLDVRCWLQTEKSGDLVGLDGTVCDPRLSYQIQEVDTSLRFHPQDFTQVNRAVNQTMVAQALAWLELGTADSVLDFFCGIGNFTLPIATQAEKVIGIEGVESMVLRGRENAELNGLKNVHFKALNLDQPELSRKLRAFGGNKFLLDPPRTGARLVCEQLDSSEMERGVYVSCNPASFVRDAVLLESQGFKLKELRVLDMFPNTAHVETMALFGK